MCYIDPHDSDYHDDENCERAERPLMEIDTELAEEYGYFPCVCTA